MYHVTIASLSLSLSCRTPAMIGCSFVVNRKFFGEIGLLDPGMDVYGGENIELGIKVCDMVSFLLGLFMFVSSTTWSFLMCV